MVSQAFSQVFRPEFKCSIRIPRIAGWKQKEHPLLYNALHIGDQVISIAGVTVSSANEANKIIRNTPSLYVSTKCPQSFEFSGELILEIFQIEFIIRRIPFGRVYAIRREIDRQCLGLIRDGNTATIIDVIPNSLSARHGLPPKVRFKFSNFPFKTQLTQQLTVSGQIL